jgi:(p)ppGpp synthase/HD superfamily hydrolase
MTPRFDEALVYAAQLHRHQRRKVGGTPYIAHLLSVAALVLEDGGDEDEAIAALLHDAVEDQGGAETLAEIRQRFGETVAEIVNGCSESAVRPKPPWKERKEKFLESLRNASPQVYRITMADKLHNARCMLQEYRNSGEQIWNQFRGGKEGTLWFLNSILAIPPPVSTQLRGELEQIIHSLTES